jgi:hypothetical protein
MAAIGCQDRRGSVAILAAISMTATVGVASLALDFGMAYAQQAKLQKVADSAAMAGASAYVKAKTTSAVNATIQDVVIANGLPSSVIQSSGSGYLATSPKNSANPAVQVTLASPYILQLAHIVSSLTSVTVGSYSVAEITGTTATTYACMTVLQTLMVNNKISAPGCEIAVNGSGNPSVTVNGGASITAASVNTLGAVNVNGTINGNLVANGKVTINSGGSVTGTQSSGATAVTDPYASVQSTASGGFNNCQNYNNQSSLSTPGCYQNVNVNSPLTFTGSGGTYYFTNININSGGSITDNTTNGVTMVTQSGFSPSSSFSLNAPTTGTYAGIALYAMGGMNINSPVQFKINGAVYAPTSTIIPDSGSWNANSCTYFVAQSLDFNSSAGFALPQTGCTKYQPTAPQQSGSGGSGAVVLVQ